MEDTKPVKRPLSRLREQWSNIAWDIAMTQVPNSEGGTLVTANEICEFYDCTPQEVAELFRLPAFIALVKETRKRVRAMGDNASTTLRAQALAGDLMEEAYKRVKREGSDTKDLIRVWERMMSFALLDPNTNGTNRPAKGASEGSGGGGSVTSVIIQVPAGIPGMEHIYQAVDQQKAEKQGRTFEGEVSNEQ